MNKMKEKKLESLIDLEHIKAEPESKYSSDVIITFDKNTNEQLLLKELGKYKIHTKKLSIGKYLLSPSDGESNDILRHYVWRYFEKKIVAEKIRR